MKGKCGILFLLILLALPGKSEEKDRLHVGKVFGEIYPNLLEEIRKSVTDFNQTHINRTLHIVINYNQTEYAPGEIIENLENDNRTVFEGINLDETDTVDLLFFNKKTLFELGKNQEHLILLKDYFFIPVSTHPASLPDPVTVLEKNQELGLVSYIESYLGSFGGEVTIDEELPSFQPISITSFDKVPESLGVDANGVCSFQLQDAGISLQLMNGDERLTSLQIPDGIDVAYKTNCTDPQIRFAEFTLRSGSDHFTKINSYDARIKSLRLTLNDQEQINGEIQFEIEPEQDLELGKLLLLNKGFTAQVSLNYTDGTGQLKWGSANGLAIHLQKNGKKIASFQQEGQIDQTGRVSGTFRQKSSATVKTSLAELTFKDLSFPAQINLLEGTCTPGAGGFSFTGTGLKNFDQSRISGTAEYDQEHETFQTELEEWELSTYGISMKKGDLFATFSADLSLKSLSGSFKFDHDSLKRNRLEVTDFLYEEGQLKKLNMSGNAKHGAANLKIVESSYISEKEIIRAGIEAEQGESNVEAEVFFYKDGSIEVPNLNFNLELPTFGPIEAELNGGYSLSDVEPMEENYYRFENIELNFSAEVNREKIDVVKATASFELDIETHAYRNVEIRLENPSEEKIDLGNFRGTFQKLDVEVNEHGELTGDITFRAEVDRPFYLLKDKLRMDQGKAQLVYSFAGNNSFEGSLQVTGMKEVSLLYLKPRNEFSGPQPLLLLENGTANRDKISGVLALSGSTGYKSHGLFLKLSDVWMEVEIENYQNMFDETRANPVIHFIKGAGTVEVSAIQGLENGLLRGEIDVDEDSIKVGFERAEKLVVNGFKLEDIKLQAILTHDLDLLEITGEMKAKHDKFDTKINVTHCHIQDGRLNSLILKGRTKLKEVDVYVRNAQYNEISGDLKLSASIKFPVKRNESYDEMNEIDLKNFRIDGTGRISILEMESRINTNPLDVYLYGRYVSKYGKDAEDKYELKFDTRFFDVEVDGHVLLGTSKTPSGYEYNYFYLAGKADANTKGIPLGPSGVMLTGLGGKFGYNFFIDYIEGDSTPGYNSFTGGVYLGLNLFKAVKLEGSANLTLRPDWMQMNLDATVKVPSSATPILLANGSLTYKIGYRPFSHEIAGSLRTEVSIPKTSGALFSMNAELDYKMRDEGWALTTGDNRIQGKIFSVVDFDGGVTIESKGDKGDSFEGELDGRMRYNWAVDYKYSFLNGAIGVDTRLKLGLDVSSKMMITEEKIDGKLIGCITGVTEISVKRGRKTNTGRIILNGAGKIYANSKKEFYAGYFGDLRVNIESLGNIYQGKNSILYDISTNEFFFNPDKPFITDEEIKKCLNP